MPGKKYLVETEDSDPMIGSAGYDPTAEDATPKSKNRFAGFRWGPGSDRSDKPICSSICDSGSLSWTCNGCVPKSLAKQNGDNNFGTPNPKMVQM